MIKLLATIAFIILGIIIVMCFTTGMRAPFTLFVLILSCAGLLLGITYLVLDKNYQKRQSYSYLLDQNEKAPEITALIDFDKTNKTIKYHL